MSDIEKTGDDADALIRKSVEEFSARRDPEDRWEIHVTGESIKQTRRVHIVAPDGHHRFATLWAEPLDLGNSLSALLAREYEDWQGRLKTKDAK